MNKFSSLCSFTALSYKRHVSDQLDDSTIAISGFLSMDFRIAFQVLSVLLLE